MSAASKFRLPSTRQTFTNWSEPNGGLPTKLENMPYKKTLRKFFFSLRKKG